MTFDSKRSIVMLTLNK